MASEDGRSDTLGESGLETGGVSACAGIIGSPTAASLSPSPCRAYEFALAHQLRMKECIFGLRQEIESLQQRGTERNSFAPGWGEGDPQVPFQLELRIIENTPFSYETLLRKWVREATSFPFGVNCPSEGGDRGVRLSFCLPETLDGTQCSISLDISYIFLPYCLNSLDTALLQKDVKAIGRAEFEVSSCVKMSCVDASLIYSVPMKATAAIDSDLTRYKEMMGLVQQLWKYLSLKDAALVLRCVGVDNSGSDAASDGEIYHRAEKMVGNCFLLMPEELIEEGTGAEGDSDKVRRFSSRGVLYRYASSDHFLLSSPGTRCEDESNEETSAIYYDIIEQSLVGCSNHGALNPLLFDKRVAIKAKSHLGIPVDLKRF